MFGETKFCINRTEKYRFIHKSDGDENGTIVLLHGMFGGLSNFDSLINKIPDYPVFVPEIPVYEFSRDELSIPFLAGWLHEILNEHQIKTPFLLGNSMGGHIALEYALSYPGEARALILTGSSGLFENDLGASKPRRYDRQYIKERAALTFYEDLVDDTIIDEILEVLQSPEKLGRLLKIARSTHEHNLEDRLHEIDLPVLLIWGKNDIITPPEVAETFHRKLSNSILKWIDECGHAPMMERPDAFGTYLIDFLNTQIDERKSKLEEKHEEDYSHY